jgi:hypothetical protein
MAYVTLADLRALPDLADETTYPDDLLEEGITYAVELIGDYCGPYDPSAPFTFTFAEIIPTSEGFRVIGVRGVQTITAATNPDGTTIDVSAWIVDYGRQLVRATDFLYGDVRVDGTNCLIAGASDDPPPVRLQWAARKIAEQYAKDPLSRIPDRALQIASDFGPIQLAQAGGPGRPTSMPEVNAILNRFRDASQIVS